MNRYDRYSKLGILIFVAAIVLTEGVIIAQSANLEKVFEIVPEGVDIAAEKEVNLRVVLAEVSPDLNMSTELRLETDQELDEVVWTIMMRGEDEETEMKTSMHDVFEFSFDHGKYNNVTIMLSGIAPSVKKRESILLMKIDQKDEPEDILITSIARYVTTKGTEDVEDAIASAEDAIADAEKAIENATEHGVDVTDAETILSLAKSHMEDANRLYEDEGKPEEALISAEYAYNNATNACKAATGKQVRHQHLRMWRDYGIIAAVIIAAIVVLIVMFRRRRWDKLR
jgi:hypothetical protein